MTDNSFRRPLVSICIPTFNRCEYLDYLLDNAIHQIGYNSEDIQLIVSDNYSVDGTWSLIDRYQKMGANLKYIRSPKNQGFTLNLNSAVQAADGEYCWLMGDDDSFRAGAIAYVAEMLKSARPDVAISNRYTCDINMKVLSADQFMVGLDDNKIFDFNNRTEMINYFNGVSSTVGMFNFISVIVVKKKLWMESSMVPGMSKTLFPHVFKVMDILRNQRGRLFFINEKTVYARTENDRLEDVQQGSEFKGWQLHFEGNIEVADYFFSDDVEAYEAFVRPIKSIILAGKAHYIRLAENEGFLDQALTTLRKLRI